MTDVMDLYEQKSTIGKGTFGKVKLGVKKENGENVAIKILEKSKIITKDDNERVDREIKILKKLSHLNVVKIFDIKETKERYYILMEYCDKGELFNYIVDKQHLSEDESSYFYYQLINGLEYIHSQNIVHRDLKPENLLLSKGNILKIIDFGLSNFYSGKLLSTPCGSPCYASPEMVSGYKYNGFCIDVWSTGIILYAMIYGYLPFEDPDNNVLFQKILECKPEISSGVSSIALDLINRIMVTNPDKRITISQIKEHPFYLKGKKIFNEKHPNMDMYNNKQKISSFNQNNSAKLLKKKELHLNTFENANNSNSNSLKKEPIHKERENLQTPTSLLQFNNMRTEPIKQKSNHYVNTGIAMTSKDKPNSNVLKSTLIPKYNGIVDFRQPRKDNENKYVMTSPTLLRHEINYVNNNKDIQYSNNSTKKTNRVNLQQQLMDSKNNYARANTVTVRSDNHLATEHDILNRNNLLSSSPQHYFHKTNIQTDINIPSSNITNTHTMNQNRNTNNRAASSFQHRDLNSFSRSLGHQNPFSKENNRLYHSIIPSYHTNTVTSSSTKPFHELYNYTYKPSNNLLNYPLSTNSRATTISSTKASSLNRPVSTSSRPFSNNFHNISGTQYNRSNILNNKISTLSKPKDHKTIITNPNIPGQNITTRVNINNASGVSYNQSYSINSATVRNNTLSASTDFDIKNKKKQNEGNNRYYHQPMEMHSRKGGINFRGNNGYVNTEYGRGSLYSNKYGDLYGGSKRIGSTSGGINNNIHVNMLNAGPVIPGYFSKIKK